MAHKWSVPLPLNSPLILSILVLVLSITTQRNHCSSIHFLQLSSTWDHNELPFRATHHLYREKFAKLSEQLLNLPHRIYLFLAIRSALGNLIIQQRGYSALQWEKRSTVLYKEKLSADMRFNQYIVCHTNKHKGTSWLFIASEFSVFSPLCLRPQSVLVILAFPNNF